MYLSKKDREEFEITLKDVLSDLNCSKQELMKRLTILVNQIQEKKVKQIEENSLHNLQDMLKKQQTLKNKDNELKKAQQKIANLQKEIKSNEKKISQIQYQLSCTKESNKFKDEAVKLYQQKIMRLQSRLNDKTKELDRLNAQYDKLDIQRQQYSNCVRKIREDCSHRIEQEDFLLKIQETNLSQSFAEDIESVRWKAKQTEEKVEKERRLLEDTKKALAEEKKRAEYLFRKNNELEMLLSLKKKTPPLIIHAAKKENQAQTDFQSKPKNHSQISFHVHKHHPINPSLNVSSLADSAIQTAEIAMASSTVSIERQTFDFQVQMQECVEQQYDDSDEAQLKRLWKIVKELDQNSKRMIQIERNKYEEMMKMFENRPARQQDIILINKLKLEKVELQIKLSEMQEEKDKNIELISHLQHQNAQLNAINPLKCIMGTTKQIREFKVFGENQNHHHKQGHSFSFSRKSPSISRRITATEGAQDLDSSSQDKFQLIPKGISYRLPSQLKVSHQMTVAIKDINKPISLFKPRITHQSFDASGISQHKNILSKYRKYSFSKKQTQNSKIRVN